MATLTDRQARLRDLFKRKQAIEEHAAETSADSLHTFVDDSLLVEYKAILKELSQLL